MFGIPNYIVNVEQQILSSKNIHGVKLMIHLGGSFYNILTEFVIRMKMLG